MTSPEIKFEIEISKQTWVILRKPCRLHSPETKKSNKATSHQAAILKVTLLKINGYNQHAHEIWNWTSTTNLTYALETMSPSDGQKDRWIGGLGESNIPPSNFIRQGHNYNICQAFNSQAITHCCNWAMGVVGWGVCEGGPLWTFGFKCWPDWWVNCTNVSD